MLSWVVCNILSASNTVKMSSSIDATGSALKAASKRDGAHLNRLPELWRIYQTIETAVRNDRKLSQQQHSSFLASLARDSECVISMQ